MLGVKKASKFQGMAGGAFYICTSISDCMLNHFSCVQLFVTLWTGAHQTPLSMGLSRQAYCSGLPCPHPRDLPNPGVKPKSLTSPALAGRFLTTSATWEAHTYKYIFIYILHISIYTNITLESVKHLSVVLGTIPLGLMNQKWAIKGIPWWSSG